MYITTLVDKNKNLGNRGRLALYNFFFIPTYVNLLLIERFEINTQQLNTSYIKSNKNITSHHLIKMDNKKNVPYIQNIFNL